MNFRANRSRSGTPHVLAMLAAVCAVCSACGDAYSTQVPTQKLTSTMVIRPDNVRAGGELDVEVMIFTPDPVNFIASYDFGSGIDVSAIVGGTGVGLDGGGVAVTTTTITVSCVTSCVCSTRAEVGWPGVGVPFTSTVTSRVTSRTSTTGTVLACGVGSSP